MRSLVRSWVLIGTVVPVLHVAYRYRLIPGDCGPDQQLTVTMRFPDEVEVVAKRVIRCGG
jgi:hypothetical protein